MNQKSYEAMRNLGMALYNKNNKDAEALGLLEKALSIRPTDLQLIYERNVVAKLQNISPENRLETWKNQKIKPEVWDEIYLQGICLFNQLGQWNISLKMLKEHIFIPAEGGEPVIAAEYCFAHEAAGYDAFRKGDTEKALKYFIDGCTMPLNIGGGVPHRVCLCPLKYGEALCYTKLGRNKDAGEALSWIVNFPVDYFTQSFLPAFQYYRGMALIGLGKEKDGREALEILKQQSEDGLRRKEYGLFSTTSEYNSYIRNPEEQKCIHYGILLALALSGLKEKERALAAINEVLRLDPFNARAGLIKQIVDEGAMSVSNP
jgi:tetratricopeptide (TPR) repeat protein